jgi:hypothetical protein
MRQRQCAGADAGAGAGAGAGASVLHMLTMLTRFVLTPFTLKPFTVLDGVMPHFAGLLPHLVMFFVPPLLGTFTFSTFVFCVAPHFMMLFRAWHHYNCRLPERERTGRSEQSGNQRVFGFHGGSS